jgi:hypothetical protein
MLLHGWQMMSTVWTHRRGQEEAREKEKNKKRKDKCSRVEVEGKESRWRKEPMTDAA